MRVCAIPFIFNKYTDKSEDSVSNSDKLCQTQIFPNSTLRLSVNKLLSKEDTKAHGLTIH